MRIWLASLCICLVVFGTAAADDASVHRMIANGRCFELLDTRQLTTRADGEIGVARISPDGRYVAYASYLHDCRVHLVRASGGNSFALLAPPGASLGSLRPTGEAWLPRPIESSARGLAWSPDSKLIAFFANHLTASPDGATLEMCMLVMTTGGLRRAVVTLPKGYWSGHRILWGPDSRRFAFVAEGSRAGQPEMISEVFVFDLLRGSLESLYSGKNEEVDIDSWSADSKALRYVATIPGQATQLRESRLDGQESVVIEENYAAKPVSPDGRLQIVEKDGLAVEDVTAGKTVQVLKTFTGDIVGWTPDGRFIVYGRCDNIGDSKDRTLELGTVWLAATESGRLNHMCAAIDVGGESPPSFSSDSTRMAFISTGRVKVAEFGWKDVSTEDKLLAGIPLTEEEEKDILLHNAKQIGTAINMYASDQDDKYPPGETFMHDILAYCRDKSIFFRPGTQDPIFQYFPLGNRSEIENHASAVMGMFDVGYGWQVILYADGHVSVKPK